MYVSTALQATNISGNGTLVTVTLSNPSTSGNSSAYPFQNGETVTLTGFTPLVYNTATAVVQNVTQNSFQFSSTATGTMSIAGTVSSAYAQYVAVPITGAAVTGSTSFQSSTTVSSITIDPITEALTSVVINKATQTANIPANTTISLAEGTQSKTGYYLQFTGPVPFGKTVTALLGFDQ